MIVLKNTKNNVFLILAIGLFTLSGCDSSRVYESYHTTGPRGWHLDSSMVFEVKKEADTLRYDGVLALRVNPKYPYRNLYVFVDQSYPSGKSRRDTINYRLAAPNGELLGKGMGAVKEFQLPIFSNKVLPGKGVYSITLTHGMRDTQLVGIEDVGFRLALHRKNS